MTKIISIINHKGGVGKTTITANLGSALARKGYSVLLVDFDPQANLSSHFGIEEEESTIADATITGETIWAVEAEKGLRLLPGSLRLSDAESHFAGKISQYTRLKKVLKSHAKDYDFVLVDCPPSLGFFTLNALTASTHIITPCEASKMASDGLGSIIQLVDDVKEDMNERLENLGVVISNRENRVVEKDFEAMIRDEYDTFESVITRRKHVKEASARQVSVFEYAPECVSVNEFSDLASELAGKLEMKKTESHV
ncbi:hypothetical protein FUAX_55940 (plasmid) [Fulvitalea axinellae]|uniref:AAA domain-containing protein n=1 Tax=Fulvitalea axinellae TaxID=1182444 RepID=A0AAU9D6Z6_9BACT|nr:hypothetical protein FUAX_55940 [Fulvitalea axinellae]